MPKGWFAIPGVQDGDRSIAMQMRGLKPALREAAGKTVLDLGCAEGCIAFEFLKAGARHVYGCDYNADLLATAAATRSKLEKPQRMAIQFERRDVRQMKAAGQYDIVLALAIIHKLDQPGEGVKLAADSARDLVVIRLPRDSEGEIVGKHSGVPCDINALMHAYGFALERTEQGPPQELVQYWRRK